MLIKENGPVWVMLVASLLHGLQTHPRLPDRHLRPAEGLPGPEFRERDQMLVEFCPCELTAIRL